jgi:hypothetical protein
MCPQNYYYYCKLLYTAISYYICVPSYSTCIYHLSFNRHRLERASPCSSPCFPRFPILSVARGRRLWVTIFVFVISIFLVILVVILYSLIILLNFLFFCESESVFRLRVYFSRHQNNFFCLSQHTDKTQSTAATSRGGEWLELEGRAKSLRQPEARHTPH